MQPRESDLQFSPTDLSHHLGCRHLTQLDAEVARGHAEAPNRHDPFLESLIERGNEHEAAYLERLQASGSSVADLSDSPTADVAATIAAMREGVDLIVQAPLAAGRWNGRADILRRTASPTRGGAFYYEPIDTKLAQETRAGTILQLCVYAEMLGSMQGELPEKIHVVTPLAEESYRTASVSAYFRFVRDRLVASVEEAGHVTYPDPVPQCDICRWWAECDQRRRADDHLSLVAGMHTLHVRELQRQQVTTVVQLGALPGLPEDPVRGNVEVYDRLRDQARLQVVARAADVPPFELLPPEDGRGLSRLPEPATGDVFLDFEGDPFVPVGGLEYLTGWITLDDGSSHAYQGHWAIDRNEEKRAFEAFMEFVSNRLEAHPDLHVYHFHHYEPSALKRLVGRYGTRAEELDRLLRAEKFIDLRAVVREGLRVGVERYGLKEMEALTGYARQLDLKDAGLARRGVELALEARDGASIDPALRDRVTDYNREDCESTAALRDWLEDRRQDLLTQGHSVLRPTPGDGTPSDNVTARDERIAAVVDPLLADIPLDRVERTEEQQARWLLAQMMGYFKREEKSAWWEHYRLRDLDHEDLLEEREAVSGLVFDSEQPRVGRQKVPTHRYRFPPQEMAVRAGQSLRVSATDDADDPTIGVVVSVDLPAGLLDVKKAAKSAALHPRAVFREQVVPAGALEGSLLALGQHVVSHGLHGDGPFQAARDLLMRIPPRRGAAATGTPLRTEHEHLLDAAVRLVRELDGGVLPVQGPPGSGKSYSGARMIATLVAEGQRVGVTAVSHKVVSNLMEEVGVAAREAGLRVRLVHKGGDEPDTSVIESIDNNSKSLATIGQGCVVGGTAWLWSHDDAANTLDYLFVDEAGQMALAQALAASRAARNLVLLGDPQQLEQPRRGAHPDGAEVAALVHVLGPERSTLTPEQGLFLDRTWRLHPSICSFTSEVYYDGRLEPVDGMDQQALAGPTPFAGSGLFLVEVEHEGNQASAPEEVAEVVGVVDALLRDGVTWMDRHGVEHPLRPDDVLVVAPYNAQVSALGQALASRGVSRVGTVDRFQGQEAPVVIYSCTSSTPEDAPRGMAFLYDPHRFNVATSRARCTVIVVASSRLFEPECRTPDQMAMANGLCRYRELAAGPTGETRITTGQSSS